LDKIIPETTKRITNNIFSYLVLLKPNPINAIIAAVIFIAGPVMLLYGCKKSSWLNQFGAVGLAYVLGIILANTGLITPEMKPLQENISSVTIALALPLLLFSINIWHWSRLAFKTIAAIFFGILSVLLIITIGNYFLQEKLLNAGRFPDLWLACISGQQPIWPPL
jgi:hypothetical protein